MYKSYDYRCGLCDHRVTELFRREEQPDTLDCENCGEPDIMRQALAAPMVLKASYPDGHKRGEKWQMTKAAAALQQEAARAKKRKDFKEAAKLNKEAQGVAKRVEGKRDNVDK